MNPHIPPAAKATLETAQATVTAARDTLAATRLSRDELLDLAAHDLKNAVGIVDSALGMLEDTPDLAPSMHAMMRRATHRLGILVRAMVDIDLIQRDALTLAAKTQRWGDLVAPVLEAAIPIGATKEIGIVAKGDLDAELTCDTTQVERILAALVDHALGTAPEGSIVDVEASRLTADRFRVRIAHRGRAVAADALEKYFATLPLRYARLAALRHGGGVCAVSPLEAGAGLAFDIELKA